MTPFETAVWHEMAAEACAVKAEAAHAAKDHEAGHDLHESAAEGFETAAVYFAQAGNAAKSEHCFTLSRIHAELAGAA